MHESYEDIRSRIADPPQWFDEHAVPRFCAFDPMRVANIYADEAVLAEVTCQSCGHSFSVAFSRDRMEAFELKCSLSDEIRTRSLHYGDPPNIGCCGPGPTMNSEPRRVMEYWHRSHREYVDEGVVTDMAYFEWRRDPALETDITPDLVTAGLET